MELQGLRMRLAAEHEMQLDRAEAARREDKGRAEERVAQLARFVAPGVPVSRGWPTHSACAFRPPQGQ